MPVRRREIAIGECGERLVQPAGHALGPLAHEDEGIGSLHRRLQLGTDRGKLPGRHREGNRLHARIEGDASMVQRRDPVEGVVENRRPGPHRDGGRGELL